MAKFRVYLLKSLKDNKFYIGQTVSVRKRLKRHNEGLVKSTKHRKPFILIGSKVFDTRNKARWFEKQLKSHSDKKERFIKDLFSP